MSWVSEGQGFTVLQLFSKIKAEDALYFCVGNVLAKVYWALEIDIIIP